MTSTSPHTLRADTQWPLVFPAQAPLWEQSSPLCSTGGPKEAGTTLQQKPRPSRGAQPGAEGFLKVTHTATASWGRPRPSLPSWLQADRCVPPSPSSGKGLLSEHRGQKEHQSPPQTPAPSPQSAAGEAESVKVMQRAGCRLRRLRSLQKQTRAEGPDWRGVGAPVPGAQLTSGLGAPGAAWK